MLYDSAKMMAMPICDSIDKAKLCEKMNGRTAKATATALQKTILRAVSTRVMAALRDKCLASVSARASSIPRTHWSAWPHDEHQHHQQVRQHGSGLRNGDRPEPMPQRRRCDMYAGPGENVEHRIVERDGERLQRADDQ